MSNRSNKITILVVPEDNSEPRSFRIRKVWLRLAYAVATVLMLHMIMGGLFYWKYAELVRANNEVLSLNHKLQEDNKRVIALADQFYALEREYQKVRSLLGVEPETGLVNASGGSAIESGRIFDNILPAVQTTSDFRLSAFDTKTNYRLTPRKSALHEFPEALPTLLPVKGILTQDFQKNSWFGPRRHSGIDIVARKGSIVRAAGAGTIIFANWTYDLGNLVIINHGNGILSYYGHNQRILNPEKSYVEKGDPIALVGSSGKSSGPHLHFEIRQDGLPIDPKEFILAFRDSSDQ